MLGSSKNDKWPSTIIKVENTNFINSKPNCKHIHCTVHVYQMFDSFLGLRHVIFILQIQCIVDIYSI